MEELILKIIEDHCDEAIYYDGDNMVEDGVVDSFTVLAIVSDLEEKLNIEIDAKYVIAENFKNKEAIIAMVKKVLKEGK